MRILTKIGAAVLIGISSISASAEPVQLEKICGIAKLSHSYPSVVFKLEVNGTSYILDFITDSLEKSFRGEGEVCVVGYYNPFSSNHLQVMSIGPRSNN